MLILFDLRFVLDPLCDWVGPWFKVHVSKVGWRCGEETRRQQRDVMDSDAQFSPQHHGTDSVSWGPGRAWLTWEESDLRSSAAPPRATLVQSTQEHHLQTTRRHERTTETPMSPHHCYWSGRTKMMQRKRSFSLQLLLFIYSLML